MVLYSNPLNAKINMPNDYFRFKQFTIHQDKSAMKVCTDACLFGAWATHTSQLGHSFLDIGTGTGLLSLMAAQKNPNIIIDAVEIDKTAAQQAKDNFESSPWNKRLNVYNLSIQKFASIQTVNLSAKYNIIISNPPFYENNFKGDDEQRNLALHSTELSLEQLLTAVDRLLADDGFFFVLLPYHRTEQFEKLAARQKLFVNEKVFVRQTPKHNYFRTMFLLKKTSTTPGSSEIMIMNSENKYTCQFVALLKEFYLYL